MGLFDTMKTKAGGLAADAERAGRVAAAQAKLVTLQNDVRKAERELGQTVFALLELGELGHPDLDAAAGALREAREALDEKAREIAELRGGTAGSSAPEEPATQPAPTAPAADPGAGPAVAAGDAPHETAAARATAASGLTDDEEAAPAAPADGAG